MTVVIAFLRKVTGSGTNSATATLTVNKGDCLVIGAFAIGGSLPTVTVSDNLGNTFFNRVNNTIGSDVISVWTCFVTVAGSSTVSATTSPASASLGLGIVSYSFGKNSIAVSANAGNTNTLIDCNQFNTAANGNNGLHFMIGIGGAIGSASISQNNGTLRVALNFGSGANAGALGICDLPASRGQIVDPTMNLSASESWNSVLVDLPPLGVVVYRGKIPHA